jgi:hypothetical protein
MIVNILVLVVCGSHCVLGSVRRVSFSVIPVYMELSTSIPIRRAQLFDEEAWHLIFE